MKLRAPLGMDGCSGAGGISPRSDQGDVIGMHDLSPGSVSPIQGPRPGSCTYCHVPHSGNGNMAPLWNQTLSTATYDTYTSTTYLQATTSRCRWVVTADCA